MDILWPSIASTEVHYDTTCSRRRRVFGGSSGHRSGSVYHGGEISFHIEVLQSSRRWQTFREHSGSSAIHHLKAAQSLLQRASRLVNPGLSSRAMVLLSERCAYTRTLAEISLDSPAEFSLIQDLPAQSNTTRELLKYIVQVELLARTKQQACSLEPALSNLESEYRAIHKAISSWKPLHEDPGLERYDKVYQEALLAYLSSIFEETNLDQSQDDPYSAGVETSFTTFIQLLSPIPSDDMCTRALCWPLAIFGSCARTEKHQVFVRNTLSCLHKMYGSCSVKQTLDLLETMWMEHDRFSRNPLGLVDVMRTTGSIVLFW